MSRPIQVGDFVQISLGAASDRYQIYDIRADGIYIHPIGQPLTQSKLVNTAIGWQVFGATQPYQLTFIAAEQVVTPVIVSPAPTLSGIPDVDIDILNRLDDRSLQSACQTNTYIGNLCRSDELWRRRTLLYLESTIPFKNPPTSWKDHYVLFKSIRTDKHGANKVAGEGHLPVLQWLAALRLPILPKQRGANDAAKNGHLLVVQWLANLRPPILPNQQGVNGAAWEGRLPVLKWLASLQQPILPDSKGANWAAREGHLPILQWLAAQQPPILPNQWGANMAVWNGQVQILQWLAAQQPHILPNQWGANWAVLNGHLPVLQWLATLQPPILPT